MASSVVAQGDDEIKGMVEVVAALCLSKEFEALRKELALLYAECGVKDVEISAFKDALFALLVQNDYMFRTKLGK